MTQTNTEPTNSAEEFAAPPLRSHPDLRIETRDIATLRPVGRQSRHHTGAQIKRIAESIRQFGFISPLIIDSHGGVLAGVARLAAARSLGMTHLPAVIVDHLSPDEQRVYILSDNRLTELASWNKEALKLELADLTEMDLGFSLDITGFTLPEIDAIVFGPDGGPGGDKIPAVQPMAVSQLGDCWLLGDHRLLVGDANSPVALEHLLAGETVRAVFTDPPYNVVIEGNASPSGAHKEFVQASGEMSDEEFTAFLTTSIGQMAASLVDGGLAYVCMDWRHMTHVTAAADAAGLVFLNLCVWDKRSGGMGSFYRSQHELVFVFKKGRGAHVNTIQLGKNGRNRANVWSYEGVTGFGADKARERSMHPTVKPLALVKDALLDCTHKGDVVLDLFGGSGTTLIAAQVSGRKARLMELDPKYADVIIRRFEAMAGEEAIHEGTGLAFRTMSFGRPERCPPPARVRSRLLV